MKYGFIKVASAIPAVKVGDVIFNTQQIEEQIALAEGKGVEIITFPELSITGYSCQDLFRQQMLLESSEQARFHTQTRYHLYRGCAGDSGRLVAQLWYRYPAWTDSRYCTEDISSKLQRVL